MKVQKLLFENTSLKRVNGFTVLSSGPKLDSACGPDVYRQPLAGCRVALSAHLSINVRPATVFAMSNIDLFATNCSDIASPDNRTEPRRPLEDTSAEREAVSVRHSADAPNHLQLQYQKSSLRPTFAFTYLKVFKKNLCNLNFINTGYLQQETQLLLTGHASASCKRQERNSSHESLKGLAQLEL